MAGRQTIDDERVVAGDPRGTGLLLDERAQTWCVLRDHHKELTQTLERREHAIRFRAGGADQRAVVARPPSAVAVHGSPSTVHGSEHGLDVAEHEIGWCFEDGRTGETIGAREGRRQFGGANAIDPAVAQHREADDHHRNGHCRRVRPRMNSATTSPARADKQIVVMSQKRAGTRSASTPGNDMRRWYGPGIPGSPMNVVMGPSASAHVMTAASR
jgi:hypothetical protein